MHCFKINGDNKQDKYSYIMYNKHMSFSILV